MPPKSASQRVVELVMERLGTDDPYALLVAMGELPQRALNKRTRTQLDANAAKKVDLWRAGSNAPSFDATMRMLSAAKLLTREAELAWTGFAEAGKEAAQAQALANRLSRAERPRGSQGTGRAPR